MILGIDASSPGSGGAQRHLIELLKLYDPTIHYFKKIKIWGVDSLLMNIPDNDFIEKLNPTLINKGFISRTFWQIFYRDAAFNGNCDVLFCPFGTYFGSFKPKVSMSRNMLLFDDKERGRFGFSLTRFKLIFLSYIQKLAFKNSNGIIFLSEYAKSSISKYLDLTNIENCIIHHGVGSSFRAKPKEQKQISTYSFKEPYKLLYVSSIWVYKHSAVLVDAVSRLSEQGYPITLCIIGSLGQKNEGEKLLSSIKNANKHSQVVEWKQKVGLNEIAEYYKNSDAFVYSSTCENMPNILIEAMSAGLPIACSNYPPMPEFLENAGLYYDPTNNISTEKAIKEMIENPALRSKLSELSYNLSQKYTWAKCASSTFTFLHQISTRKEKYV